MNELSIADVVAGAGGSGSNSEPDRRSRRSLEKRRRRRRRRAWATVLVTLVVVAGAIGGALVALRPMIASFHQPTDYPGPGSGSVEVKIPDGATGMAIGEVLQERGVVLSVKGFTSAYKANPRSATIQSGTYALKRKMSSAQAIDALLSDANRLLDRVTLKEGVRTAEVPKLVADHTKIPLSELQAALRTPSAIGLPAEAKGSAEGWLFPATYDVEPGTSAADLLGTMVQRTTEELDALGVPAAQRRNVVIMASLVQAEAKLPADFPKIAQVINNRLRRGMPLQLDSTVHYATGRYTIATSLSDTQVKSPYNTYVVAGLPLGPIGNPGRAAIDAVLHPTAGPWLYFVTVNPDTGLTKYATTPAEFAVIKHEFDNWTRANPGR